MKIFDKNGVELKEGDLIQYVNEKGFLWGKPFKIGHFEPNEERIPSFLNGFPICIVKCPATNEDIIMSKTFIKVEKGEQK